MTITPTPLVPVPTAGTSSAAAGTGKGDQAAAAGFGALLAQLAAAALQTGKAGQQPAAGNDATAADALLPSEEGDGEAEAAAAAGLPAPAGDVVTALLDPAAAPANAQAVPNVDVEKSLAETAIRGLTQAADTGAGHPIAQPTAGQPATGLPGPATSEATDPAAVPAAVQSTEQMTQSSPPAVKVSEEVLNPPAQSVSHVGGVTATTSSVQTTQPASVAGTGPAPGPAPSPLLDQVTPVVSRMVSAGEGSHRMVLRLHPADLGEVQLTVTVRGESVDVTVAAGTEARELLAGGSSELRALLDSIGRTAGQITFKDLPGTGQLQPANTLAAGAQPDAGQHGTSYGDVAGGRDGDNGGRGGGSDRAGADRSRDLGGEAEAAVSDRTGGTPGSGALDVRI